MSLAGCLINPKDVNFHHQKSLEIFDKNSADLTQKGQEDKNHANYGIITYAGKKVNKKSFEMVLLPYCTNACF